MSRSLLWAAHTQRNDEITIQTYERLFFRHKTVYVRDTRVNQLDDRGKIGEWMKEGVNASDLSPSLHYVSSGEIRGALTLQKFFILHCGKRAFVSTDPVVQEGKQNLILLGSARLENPDLYAPKYEKFRVFEGGIRPDFHDKTSEQHRRILHVLLSRRQDPQGNGVQTVLESSHGRATQGLCEQLIKSPRSPLCDALAAQLATHQHPLPDRFQAVFRVELGYGAAVSQLQGAELIKVESYVDRVVKHTAT